MESDKKEPDLQHNEALERTEKEQLEHRLAIQHHNARVWRQRADKASAILEKLGARKPVDDMSIARGTDREWRWPDGMPISPSEHEDRVYALSRELAQVKNLLEVVEESHAAELKRERDSKRVMDLRLKEREEEAQNLKREIKSLRATLGAVKATSEQRLLDQQRTVAAASVMYEALQLVKSKIGNREAKLRLSVEHIQTMAKTVEKALDFWNERYSLLPEQLIKLRTEGVESVEKLNNLSEVRDFWHERVESGDKLRPDGKSKVLGPVGSWQEEVYRRIAALEEKLARSESVHESTVTVYSTGSSTGED